MIITFKLKEL